MHLATMHAADWLRVIFIPLISAFIGWFTNWLAVKMIFRPQRPLRVLGFTIQGLVPKRQGELAASIGRTVQQHLLTHQDILAILTRDDLQTHLDDLIRERIADFVDNKLKLLNPMVAAFLSGSVRTKVQALLYDEVRKLVPQVATELGARLESELNFQAIVEERVRAFDLNKLEAIIFEIAARELKAIEVLGGVLGFAIGLLQLVFLFI